jgi:NAD(P)-dependent dehydrogenase (short-subunit alcohol dehydrogenase family)
MPGRQDCRVTGAARGIGRATAIAFARKGADVIGLDICAPVDRVPVWNHRPHGKTVGNPPKLMEDNTARCAANATGAKELLIVL